MCFFMYTCISPLEQNPPPTFATTAQLPHLSQGLTLRILEKVRKFTFDQNLEKLPIVLHEFHFF